MKKHNYETHYKHKQRVENTREMTILGNEMKYRTDQAVLDVYVEMVNDLLPMKDNG